MMDTNKTSKVENMTISEFNRAVNSIDRCYGRHVPNLHIITGGDGQWIVRGDSSFGDSYILFDRNLNWYCLATRETGDHVDFIKKENSFLTEQGANRAAIDETIRIKDANGIIILDEYSFRKGLKSFRKSLNSNNDLSERQRAVYMKNNFWVDDSGKSFYMEVSSTNLPLCRYEWTSGWLGEVSTFLMSGIPRINEHPEADRIYFVEDPHQMIFLKEAVDDPVYVKPNEFTYSYNDYLRMIKGKEVAILWANAPYDHIEDKVSFQFFGANERFEHTAFFNNPFTEN